MQVQLASQSYFACIHAHSSVSCNLADKQGAAIGCSPHNYLEDAMLSCTHEMFLYVTRSDDFCVFFSRQHLCNVFIMFAHLASVFDCLQRGTPSTPQSDLAQQLQIMRRERDAVRNTNSTLQTELERYREQVSTLQSHGSSLHSQFSVAETTKSVTNKVSLHSPCTLSRYVVHCCDQPCTSIIKMLLQMCSSNLTCSAA